MGRRRGAFGLIAALVVIAGVFACRQIVGFSDSSPAADASPEAPTSTVCGLPYGTSACASCVHANCCAESSACAADPGCSAYEGCLGMCNGDPSCRAQCPIDHPTFTALGVPALGACLASKCETPCGLACGAVGSAPGSSPDAAAACQSCVETNACQGGLACASSAECIAYGTCLSGCPTPDCKQACVSARDAGVALLAPLVNADVGSCSSQCGFGLDWSCVGHVSWPVAQSKTVAMTIAVQNSDPSPVAGAELSVYAENCPTDADAGVPGLAQGHTGTTGTVTLVVPQDTITGPAPNHGLDGCIVATAPGYLPTFWYWGFPLTAPAMAWTPTPPPGIGHAWVPLITPMDVTALNMVAGSTPDPSRGIVGVAIPDCANGGAPGVRITTDSDPAIRVLYGEPASATATVSDSTALAFLVNVPAGVLTLTATPVAIGKPSSRITVNVAANTFTEVTMYPTP